MPIIQKASLALRSIRRRPLFYTNVIALLSIGFGISVGAFGLLNYILDDAVPYRDSTDLVLLHDVFPKRSEQLLGVSEPEFSDYQKLSRSFTGLAVIEASRSTLMMPEPRRLNSAAVSSNLFSILGISTTKGRTFSVSDESPGSPPVAVVSERISRDLPGCEILANCRVTTGGMTYSVIGVLPSQFRLPQDLTNTEQTDLLTPFRSSPSQMDSLRNRHNPRLTVIGRLQPSVNLPQAQREMSLIAERLRKEYSDVYDSDGFLIRVQEIRTAVLGDASFALLMVTIGASLLFLVALVNAGTLLLIFNSSRTYTLLTTLALGAPASALRFQLLLEAFILSLAAFIPGIMIGRFIFVFVAHLSAGKYLPLLRKAHPSPETAVFAIFLSIAGAAVIFGISQSSIARAKDLIPAINREGRTSTSSRSSVRSQSVSLTLQIGLSTVLIALFLLVALSQFRLRSIDLGFQPKGVIVSQVELPPDRLKTNESVVNFFDALLSGIRSHDGLQQSCLSTNPPLVQGNEKWPFETAETTGSISTQSFAVDIVSGGCLETLTISLAEGTDLPVHKNSATTPQALVSQSFARQMWPTQSAVGKQIRANLRKNSPWITIIGVVNDIRHEGPNADVSPTVYLHYGDIPAITTSSARFMRLLTRTQRTKEDADQLIQKAAAALDHSIPAEPLGSLTDILAESIAPWLFTGQLLSITSVVGPIIAISGLYSLLSALVLLRRKEIAIRIAVGASTINVFCLLVRQTVLRIFIGGIAGICALLFMFSKLNLYLPQTTFSEAIAAAASSLLALLVVGIIASASLVPSVTSHAASSYRNG